MSRFLVRYRFFLVVFLLVGFWVLFFFIHLFYFFLRFKQKISIFVDDLNMNSKEFQFLNIYVTDLFLLIGSKRGGVFGRVFCLLFELFPPSTLGFIP